MLQSYLKWVVVGLFFSFTAFCVEVKQVQFANGLKAAFVSHDANQYVIEMRVGAGFIDEQAEETGVAHWLEHGLFRGQSKFPNKALFEKELERLGISYNASTTFERTSYYFVIPKENILAGISLFMGMFSTPMLDPKEMESELEPVKQEALRDAINNPRFDFYMAALSLHAKSPRMKKYMTGLVTDMEKQNGSLPRRFFERMYSASNMTVSLVGPDVMNQHIQQLLDQEIQKIKTFPIPARGNILDEVLFNNQENGKGLKPKLIVGEKGSPRQLSIAYMVKNTLENEANAKVLARVLNRADSPLKVLVKEGYILNSSVGIESYLDVLRFDFQFFLTEKGERNLTKVFSFFNSVLGSIQNRSLAYETFSAESSNLEAALKPSLFVLKQKKNFLNIGSLLTEYLAHPEGLAFLEKKASAIRAVDSYSLQWIAGQLSPDRALITYRSDSLPEVGVTVTGSSLHPEVQRPVLDMDWSNFLPGFVKFFNESNQSFTGAKNRYLDQPTPRILTKTLAVGKLKVQRNIGYQLLIDPKTAADGSSESYLEFRFPKSKAFKSNEIDLVKLKLAVAAFEHAPNVSIFIEQLKQAGIELGFQFDKSETKLQLRVAGPAHLTARAIRDFMALFKSFVLTDRGLVIAKEQLKESLRMQESAEVSLQAVSAGIKKIQKMKFLHPAKERELIDQISVQDVVELFSVAQNSWSVQGVLRANWEEKTLQSVIEALEAQKPLYVKKSFSHPYFQGLREDVEFSSNKVFTLTEVNRRGVARLYPVMVEKMSHSHLFFLMTAKILQNRLMQKVRTDLKLAYAVDAGFAMLKNGGVLYLRGDSSHDSDKMLKGFDWVMRDLLIHGVSEDELLNAKREVIQRAIEYFNSADGLFDLNFKSIVDPLAKNPNQLIEVLSKIRPSTLMLIVKPAIEKSLGTDSVVAPKEDSFCADLLTKK